MDKVYIIIVNWNGWKDTIECLESVFRNDYPSYQVLVCDNGSQDGSLDKIRAWAAGNLQHNIPQSNPLYILSSPSIAKPISIAECNRAEAESENIRGGVTAQLLLIRNETNLGFAGGNNVGLRYALRHSDFSYVWLLNNDVVIKPDALTHLVRRMQDKKDAGICGSTIPYYAAPDTIWSLGGGKYNKWLAYSHSIGNRQQLRDAPRRDDVERALDYVAGASMLVSYAFLKDVGLMAEDYFLYYEEPDWALRGKNKYTIAYAPESIVYHKVGMSTRILDIRSNGYKTSQFYAMKSHILFACKFFPYCLPIVLARICLQWLVMFLKRTAARFK